MSGRYGEGDLLHLCLHSLGSQLGISGVDGRRDFHRAVAQDGTGEALQEGTLHPLALQRELPGLQSRGVRPNQLCAVRAADGIPGSVVWSREGPEGYGATTELIWVPCHDSYNTYGHCRAYQHFLLVQNMINFSVDALPWFQGRSIFWKTGEAHRQKFWTTTHRWPSSRDVRGLSTLYPQIVSLFFLSIKRDPYENGRWTIVAIGPGQWPAVHHSWVSKIFHCSGGPSTVCGFTMVVRT